MRLWLEPPFSHHSRDKGSGDTPSQPEAVKPPVPPNLEHAQAD